MKILSFDTSNSLASVAIMIDNQLIAYEITNQNSEQAEKLFSLIKQTLEKTKLTLNELDLISVTNGPGSFTGVRIGLAAALGLKLCSNNKFIALTNFQVLAWQAQQLYPDNQIAVVLDARRDQVYLQIFNQKLEPLNEPELIAIADVNLPKDVILVGDAAKFFPSYNIPLSKLASVRGFEGDSERRTAVYEKVHEDSSTESTHKSPTEVEFRKRYNLDPRLTNNANAELLAASSQFYLQNNIYQDLSPLYIREPDTSKPA